MKKLNFRSGTLCIVAGGAPCFANPENRRMFRSIFRIGKNTPTAYQTCPACGNGVHGMWDTHCRRCGADLSNRSESTVSGLSDGTGKIMASDRDFTII